jgi:hypothetical protein
MEAEEKNAIVPNAPPQPPPPPLVPGKRTVDLIPLANPRRDAVEGTWAVSGNALHTKGGLVPRLQFPYEPPLEYDFIVTFSQPAPGNGVFLVMPNPRGDSFYWVIGKENGTRFEISTNPPTGGQKPGLIKRDTPCTTVVEVRRNGVRALLDGVELIDHKTDFEDLKMDVFRRLKNTERLGVACDDPTVFHHVRVVEITGRGKKR